MTLGTRMAIQREANRLELGGGARFRRRRAVVEDQSGGTLVRSAVQGARAGDDDSLRFLYLRYADSVYSYVCSIVRSEHDAEDITQAVFAKLPSKLENYRRQAVPFSSWIMRVAHNAAVDHLRSRRTSSSETVEDVMAADDTGRERLEALRVALSRIPEGQREILALRFIGGLTPRETAEQTGRTEKAVHALQHRARKALCHELEVLEAAPTTRVRAAA